MYLIHPEAKSYSTIKNAKKALENVIPNLADTHWLIAVAPDGRFVPVLVGAQYIPYAHRNITVVG